MRATTLKQQEAEPSKYPDVSLLAHDAKDWDEIWRPLSELAARLDPVPLWQRIEAYVSHRWTPREVVWTIEGPGEWTPPLVPATISTVEVWEEDSWVETFDVRPSPCEGLIFAGVGPYRVTAIVGADNPAPKVVLAAFLRLAEFVGADLPRLTLASRARGTTISWLSTAMQGSGAGDLLRPYRRAG